MTLVIAGGEVVGATGEPTRLDVVCRDGVVAELCPPGAVPVAGERMDAADCWVAPGFVDLQINGAFGHDFTTDPGSIAEVAAELPRYGVTAFAPTIVTAPAEARTAALDALAALRRRCGEPGSAVPIGLHLEGPLISPERAGAHAAEWIGEPATVDTGAWDATRGVVLVTLAPELPGALALIRTLTARGVVVSAGHTACTAAELLAARDAGLRAVTHLYNAMPSMHHRAPGPVGAVLADDALVAGLICDGIHVDPTAVRVAWRALGRGRTMLVSDAVAALGAPAGEVTLGGNAVEAGDTGVRDARGVLAGGALALDGAVRNLVGFTGCTVGEAVAAATATPCALVGLADRGRVAAGARADLVVLDPSLRPVLTVVGGEVAWRS